MASVGLVVGAPNTEERAVFTQLKPVRMCTADGPEDSSVFEDVKPAVRLATHAVEMVRVLWCLAVTGKQQYLNV